MVGSVVEYHLTVVPNSLGRCVFFRDRYGYVFFFFFSSRRRHTRSLCDWSSDVCSSDLGRSVSAGSSATQSRACDVMAPGDTGPDEPGAITSHARLWVALDPAETLRPFP